jgi:hypothetical protein
VIAESSTDASSLAFPSSGDSSEDSSEESEIEQLQYASRVPAQTLRTMASNSKTRALTRNQGSRQGNVTAAATQQVSTRRRNPERASTGAAIVENSPSVTSNNGGQLGTK